MRRVTEVSVDSKGIRGRVRVTRVVWYHKCSEDSVFLNKRFNFSSVRHHTYIRQAIFIVHSMYKLKFNRSSMKQFFILLFNYCIKLGCVGFIKVKLGCVGFIIVKLGCVGFIIVNGTVFVIYFMYKMVREK